MIEFSTFTISIRWFICHLSCSSIIVAHRQFLNVSLFKKKIRTNLRLLKIIRLNLKKIDR